MLTGLTHYVYSTNGKFWMLEKKDKIYSLSVLLWSECKSLVYILKTKFISWRQPAQNRILKQAWLVWNIVCLFSTCSFVLHFSAEHCFQILL